MQIDCAWEGERVVYYVYVYIVLCVPDVCVCAMYNILCTYQRNAHYPPPGHYRGQGGDLTN